MTSTTQVKRGTNKLGDMLTQFCTPHFHPTNSFDLGINYKKKSYIPLICVCQTASPTPHKPAMAKKTNGLSGCGRQKSIIVTIVPWTMVPVDICLERKRTRRTQIDN